MLSPIKNYSCQKLLKIFNLRRKDVLKHATKSLCLLSKLHLLASCGGGTSCHVYTPCSDKGEAKKPTRLPRESKRKAVRSMNKVYPLLKMRKNAMGATFGDASLPCPVSHTHSNHMDSEFSVASC